MPVSLDCIDFIIGFWALSTRIGGLWRKSGDLDARAQGRKGIFAYAYMSCRMFICGRITPCRVVRRRNHPLARPGRRHKRREPTRRPPFPRKRSLARALACRQARRARSDAGGAAAQRSLTGGGLADRRRWRTRTSQKNFGYGPARLSVGNRPSTALKLNSNSVSMRAISAASHRP